MSTLQFYAVQFSALSSHNRLHHDLAFSVLSTLTLSDSPPSLPPSLSTLIQSVEQSCYWRLQGHHWRRGSLLGPRRSTRIVICIWYSLVFMYFWSFNTHNIPKEWAGKLSNHPLIILSLLAPQPSPPHRLLDPKKSKIIPQLFNAPLTAMAGRCCHILKCHVCKARVFIKMKISSYVQVIIDKCKLEESYFTISNWNGIK